MHRRLSIASATFALAVALTAHEAFAPAASKEAPKQAQALITFGILPAAPTAPAAMEAPKQPAIRTAQAQSAGGPPPLKKFRVLLPFKAGTTVCPISGADERCDST